jgi:hypothetical protein
VAYPEQVGDLLERGVARQFVNVIASIDELAFLSENVTERRGRRDDPFQALRLR